MSLFRNTIAFFVELGVYDVVLPFLLVFTLVYAMLEKSKVLGLETDKDGTKVSRKNLNAMIAFVAAFLVVASTRLVAIVNTVVANSMLLLLLGVLFLMLVGIFYKDEELDLPSSVRWTFMGLMFIGIALIFLHALGWLQAAWNFIADPRNVDGPVLGSLVMLVIVIGAIAWLTSDRKKSSSEEKS